MRALHDNGQESITMSLPKVNVSNIGLLIALHLASSTPQIKVIAGEETVDDRFCLGESP